MTMALSTQSLTFLMIPSYYRGRGPGDDPDRNEWWFQPIWEMNEMYYFASFPGQGDAEVHHDNDDDCGDDGEEPSLNRSRVDF